MGTYYAVNSAMVRAYWSIGKVIVEEEQKGRNRAEYGTRRMDALSSRLSREYGRGFDDSNLRFMRQFYVTFPKCDALRRELTWTHYRLLLRQENEPARSFYLEECINARWSTRELERQRHLLGVGEKGLGGKTGGRHTE